MVFLGKVEFRCRQDFGRDGWVPTVGQGLPVAIDTMPANTHECKLVQRLFDFMLTEEKPTRLIGDKAYDSDPVDQRLLKEHPCIYCHSY